MKYYIKIREILEKTIPIDADDEMEAFDIVKDKYRKEQIVLGAGDYVTTEFLDDNL